MDMEDKDVLARSSLRTSTRFPDQLVSSTVDTLSSSLYGNQSPTRVIPQNVIDDVVESGRSVVGISDYTNNRLNKLRDANDSLINNNIELLMANDRYQKTLSETNNSFNNEKDALMTQKEMEITRNRQLERANKSLNDDNSQKNEEIMRLNRALRNKEEELKIHQVSGVSKKTSEIDGELKLKIQENTDLKSELTTKNEMYNILKKELLDKSRDFESTRRYMEATIEDLKFELSNKKITNEASKKFTDETNTKYKSEMDELKTKVSFLEKIINEKDERNENLRNSLMDALEKGEELNDNIAIKDGEISALNKKINALLREAKMDPESRGLRDTTISQMSGMNLVSSQGTQGTNKGGDFEVKYEQTQRELELQNEIIEKTKTINLLNERIFELEAQTKVNTRKIELYEKDEFDAKNIDDFIVEEKNNRLQKTLAETEQKLKKKIEEQAKFMNKMINDNDVALKGLQDKYVEMETESHQKLVEKDEKVSQLYRINKENEVAFNNKINEFVLKISNLEKENDLLAKQNKIVNDNLQIYKRLKEKSMEKLRGDASDAVPNFSAASAPVSVAMRQQQEEFGGRSRSEVFAKGISMVPRDQDNDETLVSFLRTQNAFLTEKNKEVERENKELTKTRMELENTLNVLKLDLSNLQVVNNSNLEKIKEQNVDLARKKKKALSARNELKLSQQNLLELSTQLKVLQQKEKQDRFAKEQREQREQRASIGSSDSLLQSRSGLPMDNSSVVPQMSQLAQSTQRTSSQDGSSMSQVAGQDQFSIANRTSLDSYIFELEAKNRELRTKVSSLEMENKSARTKIEQIKSEMNSQNKNFEEIASRYTENLQGRNRVIEELKEKNIQLSSDKEDLLNQVSRYTAELKLSKANDINSEENTGVRQFMSNYTEIKQENMKLRQQIMTANEKVSEMLGEAADLKAKVSNLEERNQRLVRDHDEYRTRAKSSIEKLKKEIINAKTENTPNEDEDYDSDGERETVRVIDSKTTESLPKKSSRQLNSMDEDPHVVRVSKDYLADCERLSGEFEILSNQLDEYKAANAVLEDTIKKQSSVIVTLQNDVNQNHSNDLEYINRNNSTIIELNSTIASLEKKVKALTEGNDDQEQVITGMNRNLDDQANRLEELEEEIEKSKRALEGAKEEAKMLREIIKANQEDADKAVDELQRKLAKAQAEGDKLNRLLKQEIDHRNTDIANFERTIGELQKNNEQQNNEAERLKGDINVMLGSVQGKEDQIMLLQHNINDCQKINTVINSKLAYNSDRLKLLEERNARLVDVHSKLVAENQVLRSQIDEVKKINSELQDSTRKALAERAQQMDEVQERMQQVVSHFTNGSQLANQRIAEAVREISLLKALKMQQNNETGMSTVMQLQAECECLRQSLDDVSALAASLEEQNTLLSERIAEYAKLIDNSRIEAVKVRVEAQHTVESSKTEAVEYREKVQCVRDEYEERIAQLSTMLDATIERKAIGAMGEGVAGDTNVGSESKEDIVDEKLRRDLKALKDFTKSVVRAQNEHIAATGSSDGIVVPSMGYVAQMAINPEKELPK